MPTWFCDQHSHPTQHRKSYRMYVSQPSWLHAETLSNLDKCGLMMWIMSSSYSCFMACLTAGAEPFYAVAAQPIGAPMYMACEVRWSRENGKVWTILYSIIIYDTISWNLAILMGNDDQAVHMGIAWVHYFRQNHITPNSWCLKKLAMVRLAMFINASYWVMVNRCHSSKGWEIKLFANGVVGSMRVLGRLHLL